MGLPLISIRARYNLSEKYPSSMPEEMPLVMSKRFQRSAAAQYINKTYHKSSKRMTMHSDSDGEDQEEFRIAIKSSPHSKITSNSNISLDINSNSGTSLNYPDHGRACTIKENGINTIGSVAPSPQSGLLPIRQRGQGNLQRAMSITSAHGASGSIPMHTASANKKEADVRLGIDTTSYTPFQLSSKSSFNPSQLTTRQLNRLDMLTKAKYMSYEKPSFHVIEQIGNSERRSRKWLRDEHLRIQTIIETARKKWNLLHKAVEDPAKQLIGQQSAAIARIRMKEKVKKIMDTREDELQFLVEGQTTSIDAIRLKEHLVLRSNMPKVGRMFSEKDRLRVEELLE
ncbi:LKAAEAR motif containing 1 [Batrachochytrium dendrobatidis]|nr:LKAAEAR motif containing 1 [Batrachochytrium dendrobatidis]